MVGITHCPSRQLRGGRVHRPRLMNKTIPLSFTSPLVHASVEMLSSSVSQEQNKRLCVQFAGASSNNDIVHLVSGAACCQVRFNTLQQANVSVCLHMHTVCTEEL